MRSTFTRAPSHLAPKSQTLTPDSPLMSLPLTPDDCPPPQTPISNQDVVNVCVCVCVEGGMCGGVNKVDETIFLEARLRSYTSVGV